MRKNIHFLFKKKASIFYIIFIIFVGLFVFGFNYWNEIRNKQSEVKKDITVVVDKNKYKQGESVKITIENNLDVPIFYAQSVNCGASFWFLKNCSDREIPYHMICLWVTYQHNFTKLEAGGVLKGAWDGDALDDNYNLVDANKGCYKIVFPYSLKEKPSIGETWGEDRLEAESNTFITR